LDEIVEVMFVLAPAVVPCTVMLNVQEPFGASVAPERLTVPVPAAAVLTLADASVLLPRPAAAGSVTPGGGLVQPPVRPFGEAIIKPAGSTSVNPMALRKVSELGLWMVKLSEVVPFRVTLAAPNALLMVGGAITVVTAVELLFPGVGSAVGALAVAVFEIDPAVFRCTTSVTVSEPALEIVARVQLTVVAPLQLPTDGVAETNVVPTGRVSVTVAMSEVLGPAFETVMV
jgi:hypothetical protein